MFGRIIVAHRQRLGMTQEELAERTGLSTRSLRDMETGRVRAPRKTSVRLLADAFGLSGPERERFFQQAVEPAKPPPEVAPAGNARAVVPAQLPADVPGFTGRHSELARLDTLVAGAVPAGRSSTAMVSAVFGTAGVGKTALVVHWAHRVRAHFPDGQLYVNLRGFDPTGSAIDPADAVGGFLDALGAAPQWRPTTMEARVGLYRSLLSGRRILVVLDNARDAEQVRPLLPGSSGCLALITSRDQLTSLVAVEGARPLALDLLTVAEAQEFLGRRLSEERVAAELDEVDAIITLCGRLPLALAIVAARATARPAFALKALTGDLRGDRRLDVLDGGDPVSSVRSVFSWSYDTLSADAARLFRLLGLHPGPDVSVPAAASLAGVSHERAGQLLDGLAAAHLLTEHTAGRFTFHDLLRAYATHLVREKDSAQERRDAVHRMLDHYLHTARACDRFLSPLRDPVVLPPPHPGTTPESVTGYQAAMSWFITEHTALLAVIAVATRTGFDLQAVRLAWAMQTYFDRRGHWQDWISTQHTALACAQRTDDVAGRAAAHRALGRAYTYTNRYADAEPHLMAALNGYDAIDDRAGKAYAHLNFAILMGQQDRHDDALTHASQALRLFDSIGHRAGEAHALNAIGWAQIHLGDYDEAFTHCSRSVSLHQRTGNRNNEGVALDSLGRAHHHLGQYQKAIDCYRRALDIYHEFDSRYFAAETLIRLADTHDAAADAEAARGVRQRALAILDELGHPDAGRIRQQTNRGG